MSRSLNPRVWMNECDEGLEANELETRLWWYFATQGRRCLLALGERPENQGPQRLARKVDKDVA